MDFIFNLATFLFTFLVGLYIGVTTEAKKWRRTADYPFERMQSGGKLYDVNIADPFRKPKGLK